MSYLKVRYSDRKNVESIYTFQTMSCPLMSGGRRHKRKHRMRGGEQLVGAPATEPNLGGAKANYEVTGKTGYGFPNGSANVSEAVNADKLPGSIEIVSKQMAADASGGITNIANVFGNLTDTVKATLGMKGGMKVPIQSGYGLDGPVGTVTGPAAGPGLVQPYSNAGALRPENYPFPEPLSLRGPMQGGSRRRKTRRRFVQYGCKSRKGGSHHLSKRKQKKLRGSKKGGCWTKRSRSKRQRGGSTAGYEIQPSTVVQSGSALAMPIPVAAYTGCSLTGTHNMYGSAASQLL